MYKFEGPQDADGFFRPELFMDDDLWLCFCFLVDFVSAPFHVDQMYKFEGHQDADGFFRPALRSYLVCKNSENVYIFYVYFM